MTAYMFAISASKFGVKMKSIELYTEIEPLGKRIIRYFYEKPSRRRGYGKIDETPERLEDFVIKRRHFKVYFFDVNSGRTGKLITGQKIWDAMRREEGLKKEITKAMLR
jgi:hypothetical protein